MSDHVIDLSERAAFRRCRRAWDFSAASRRNLSPNEGPTGFDLPAALKVALAAYYFPAMSGWSRSVVRPIALDAYAKASRAQAGSGGDGAGAGSAAAGRSWDEAVESGRRLLDRYFDWAPDVDDFIGVRAAAGFDVPIADPGRPGAAVAGPGGAAIRLRGIVDLLAVDDHNRTWVVEHRLVEGPWCDPEVLRLDDHATTLCWAAEDQYFSPVSGVIVTELRLRPDGAVAGGDHFRRTRIRMSPHQLRSLRRQVAAELPVMVSEPVALYPSPSPTTCAGCPFLAPCEVMQAGQDPGLLLAASYHERVPEVIALPPRTGSCGPQVVQGWKTKGR